MSLQEEELVSSHAGQPEQASSLLDQIMAQTRIQPGSEGYDVARQGVTAFIASILQSTASAEPVNKLVVDSMIADIDERISRQMDVIIHAPAFQQVESFWRSLKTMVDRVDFRENIKVNVLHVTKQELLEDFEFAPEIIQSGFYKHVYSSGFGQFGGEPIAAVLGAYEFKNTAPDMKLLQYVSAVGAMAHAPFLSSVSPEFMGLNSWTELPNIKDLYAIFEGPAYTKWRALRDSEDSRYLGLTAPRFLLRQPYSPTDNPVKNFNYYEDVSQNHEDYLWGNTAWMLACNIADSFAKYRWCPNIIGPQSGGAVKDLPVHLFETMGQIQAKIPTEVLVTDRREFELAEEGFITLTMRKDSDNAAFFSANSVQKPKHFPGKDAETNYIQVGSLKEQPSEITVTLLTEPDTNTNAEGESAAVDVQLVYLTDDSKLLASHLLENLPEEKLASALKDDNPNWEYIDGEIVKLGSLAHSQLDIPELQRRGLVILASESKDFRLLAHLLRTLQHAGDPHLALRLLALYVEHYWAVAAPQNMAHKKRFASQVIKRFETGIEGFSQNAATEQRDALSGELAKLAQCWQSHNAPELAQATDDLFALYQRAFNRAAPAPVPTPAASGSSPQTTATSESGVTQPSAPAPQIVIDSHDDKAWRDTLLKVAAILCERQPDSPQGYRLRRHALWQNITSTPQAESDGRTPLAAVSADMVADYHAQLGSADMTLWQQVEKSVLLAPYWLDGHCLSAQTALRLGYKQVADAIRDEVIRFLERLPQLTGLLFNDHTPFISEQTKQWLAASPDAKVAPVAQIGEESKAARACFAEQGLEAALRYLDMLPEGDPRDQFHRQYLAAQLTEEAGLVQLAQQQYRMLFRMGLQMMVADWEPSLLEQLEQKFTAEQ